VQFYVIYPLLFALRRRVGMPAIVAAVALVNVASAWLLERHDLQFFTSYWLSWTVGAWIADVRAQPARGATAVPSRWWYGAAALLLAAGCGVPLRPVRRVPAGRPASRASCTARSRARRASTPLLRLLG
jgi:peptidoglycan/LPS O-acetylase OafA/YrhL